MKSYPALVEGLRKALGYKAALEAAVGGDFLTVGKLECALLRQLGLRRDSYVIDVGCGSGRLALQLSHDRDLRYLGTDVVDDLLLHARAITQRPDWQFMRTEGIRIPESPAVSDFVCFFSVLTHLTHEDSFRYLREAKRVLKPGGLIVFSFLEFHVYSHWAIFSKSVDDEHPGDHLNQFIGRDAIQAWAHHLELDTLNVFDGDKPHIVLPEPVTWSDGRIMAGQGSLGQSVAVLRKPV